MTKAHRQWLSYVNQAYAWLERMSRRKKAMCLVVLAVTLAARMVLLPKIPIPEPRVPDEFAYLLGAETFASGRLTNPAHPMWVHFETLMELAQPTYASKYPPGQSLVLAIGWTLFGHPWFGVWISFGLFAACLCWMLQNWVPPVYALFGTAITLARVSVAGYWMNSYWGGAVAAAAGCLVLGVLPRLARQGVRSRDVVVASIGLVLLANTRPYEGLVMSAVALVALLMWRRRRQRKLSELLSVRCLLPLLLVCGTGASLDAYYNYRVTGNALVTPYALYMQQYQVHSPWILFSERKTPVYRHVDIENTWKEQNAESLQARSKPVVNLKATYAVVAFFWSALCAFPVIIGILLSRGDRPYTAGIIWMGVCLSLFLESIKAPHYVAGGVGLFALVAVYGLRWLRVIGRDYGPLLVVTLVALLCLRGKAPEGGQSWETGRTSPRMIAAQEVRRQSGRHLILVRYSLDHIDRGDECVYNGADIDASEIVWARDMGEAKNSELLDYYKGKRRVWIYQPDTSPGKLIPYQSVSQ